MIKEYKVTKYNSTVCGYSGRGFDWSKFCWDGKAIHRGYCKCPDCKHRHTQNKAPIPWVDDFFIEECSQYLHVPYAWKEMGTIYRVRPTMTVCVPYRGHLVKSIKAIKKADG